MSYTRAAATEYLLTEFAALWQAAGVRPDRVLLDSAFRVVGVAEADLPRAYVGDSAAPQLEAVLDYYGLRRLARAFAGAVTTVNRTANGLSTSDHRGDLYTHVMGLLAQAEARVRGYGLLAGSPSVAWFRINLDLLEPPADAEP